MGLWYLCTLLFVIFSGLYFGLDKERLNPSADYRTEIAGLFDACRQAGTLQAAQNPLIGATAALPMTCNTAYWLTASSSRNLIVDDIKIIAQPRSLREPGQTGRVVVTYVPVNQAVKRIPFGEVSRQIREVLGNSVMTGLVTGTAADPVINGNYGNNQVKVPLTVPLGSVASIMYPD